MRRLDQAHGLYLQDGQRVQGWVGKIVMDFESGQPRLEPGLRLEPGQKVFAWYEGKLVGVFGDGGCAVKVHADVEEIQL